MIIIGVLSILLITLVSLIAPSLVNWSQHLLSRAPLNTDNTEILVSIWDLSPAHQSLVKSNPERVEVYRISPQLSLIGLGKKVEDNGQRSPRLSLRLFEASERQKISEDAQFKVRVGPPSITLYLFTLLQSARGEEIRSKLHGLRSLFLREANDLWPYIYQTIQGEFTRRGTPTLYEDAILLQKLKAALIHEVSSELEFNHALSVINQSPELASLWSLITDGIELTSIGEQGLRGSINTGLEEWENMREGLRDTALDGNLFLQSLICLNTQDHNLKEGNISERASLKDMIIQLTFGQRDERVCDHLKEAFTRTVFAGVKESGKAFSAQAWKHFSQQPERGIEATLQMSSVINRELKISQHSWNFVQTLFSDQELINYIEERYGQPAVETFRASLNAMAAQPRIQESIQRLKTEIQSIVNTTLAALFLDSSQSGPHPLLISLIQDKLSRKQKAVVWFLNGVSATVAPSNYVFNPMPLDQVAR